MLEYGSYVDAVSGIDARLNSGSSGGSPDIVGTTGNANNDRAAKDIVAAMKLNSARWFSVDDSEKANLNKANLKLAAQLESLLQEKITRDADGVWWLGSRRLYDVYHKGGIVGGASSTKQNEVMALLEKGEAVLDKKREDALFKLVDFVARTSERMDGFLKSGLGSVVMSGRGVLPSVESLTPPSMQSSEVVFSPNITLNIAHNGSMSETDAARFGRIAAESTLSELADAFSRRGIGRFANAAII